MKKLPFIMFLFFAFSLILFSSGCKGDDDCSDDLVGTPSSSGKTQEPSIRQLLTEIEEVENSDGYFLIFKEGGPFNDYRSSGLQVHGVFGEKGPSLLVNGVELLDETTERLNTTSNEARTRISEYFRSGKSALFKLSDVETKELVLAESPINFPSRLVVRADEGLQGEVFSRDTKIEWESSGNGEVLVVIYTGPGTTVPGLVQQGSSNHDYNVFSIPDSGSYQFSNNDFKDFKSKESVTIMIIRYEKAMVREATSSNMILALTATGSNYVLP